MPAIYILQDMRRLESAEQVQRTSAVMQDLRESGMLKTLGEAQVSRGLEFLVEAFVSNKKGELKSEITGKVVEKDATKSRVLVETSLGSKRMWLPSNTPAAEWGDGELVLA